MIQITLATDQHEYCIMVLSLSPSRVHDMSRRVHPLALDSQFSSGSSCGLTSCRSPWRLRQQQNHTEITVIMTVTIINRSTAADPTLPTVISKVLKGISA